MRSRIDQTFPLTIIKPIGNKVVQLQLRASKVEANMGFIVGSISGREQGAKIRMAALLGEANMAHGFQDHDFYALSGIAAHEPNYEELFFKLALIHLQTLIYHRVDNADIAGVQQGVEYNSLDLPALERLASRHRCIIRIDAMGPNVMQLLYRSSLAWPSQVVTFNSGHSVDITNAIAIPASDVGLFTHSQAIAFESGLINMDPCTSWSTICRLAEYLDAVEDMSLAFKKARELSGFFSSILTLNLSEHIDLSDHSNLVTIDVCPAIGMATAMPQQLTTRLYPTELFASSCVLLMEATECNNIWNRLHAVVETLGLPNSALYGQDLIRGEVFLSLGRELGIFSGSNFSPLPNVLFGPSKIVQCTNLLKQLLVQYTYMLRKPENRTNQFLNLLSSFPIKVDRFCSLRDMHHKVRINVDEATGVLAHDLSYANKVLGWLCAVGLDPSTPVGGSSRIGDKTYVPYCGAGVHQFNTHYSKRPGV